MIKIIRIIGGICSCYFFIVGCCTTSHTSKRCTCKKIYKEVAHHLNENVDTFPKVTHRFIKNKSLHLDNEVFAKIKFWFNENKTCWIGKKKQLLVNILGKPDSDIVSKSQWGNRVSAYTFTIERKFSKLLGYKRTSSLYVKIHYQIDLTEKINRIGAGYDLIIVE